MQLYNHDLYQHDGILYQEQSDGMNMFDTFR